MSSSSDQYRIIGRAAGWMARTWRGWLRVEGRDAPAFLHNLLSNDIASLAPGDGAYATYLTPQGRMIADVAVYRLSEHLWLDVPRAEAARLADQFDALVFTEDVPAGQRVRVRILNTDNGAVQAWTSGPFKVLSVDARDVNGPTDVEDRRVSVPAGGRYDLEVTAPARVQIGSTALVLGEDPGAVPEPREELDMRRRSRMAPAAGKDWHRPGQASRGPRRAAGPARDRQPRPADWRPGGEHRDPRQPFKDAKKARNQRWRAERFTRKNKPGTSGASTVRTPGA